MTGDYATRGSEIGSRMSSAISYGSTNALAVSAPPYGLLALWVLAMAFELLKTGQGSDPGAGYSSGYWGISIGCETRGSFTLGSETGEILDLASSAPTYAYALVGGAQHRGSDRTIS